MLNRLRRPLNDLISFCCLKRQRVKIGSGVGTPSWRPSNELWCGKLASNKNTAAICIVDNRKSKIQADKKHKLNIRTSLSYLRGRGKICLGKVGAHVLLLLSRKVWKDLIMFANQLVNSGMNRPKRIRNRTLRLTKKCRIRIWKQSLALIKNFHLHKKVKSGNTITPKALYLALAVKADGSREVLGM